MIGKKCRHQIADVGLCNSVLTVPNIDEISKLIVDLNIDNCMLHLLIHLGSVLFAVSVCML